MRYVIPLSAVRSGDVASVGSKAVSLARMSQPGLRVPRGFCISVSAYDAYVGRTGLRERIMLELSRKSFTDMRWEEMWDAALRIRNMFLLTPLPTSISGSIETAITREFADKPVVVRSSAPGEDSSGTSFAGLHESYVNVVGAHDILDRVRLVWASLWSDAALLYRQELGLDVESSKMAVVVQELVAGERSGVVFTRSPSQESQAVIEAVYGLNQGLVDGTVEPDRWFIDRRTGDIAARSEAKRESAVFAGGVGSELRPLPPELAEKPPLSDQEVRAVYELAMRAEAAFGAPQDVEWTWRGEAIYLLQSRPITTLTADGPGDRRAWDLSLRRSYGNLVALRAKIEDELVPGMIEDAARLTTVELGALSDEELAAEIQRRRAVFDGWVRIYWADFIPFAHGARLFGQFYSDVVRPTDPFEFIGLLGGGRLKSLERNRLLSSLALLVREDPRLADRLASGALSGSADFDEGVRRFLEGFAVSGDLLVDEQETRRRLADLLRRMSAGDVPEVNAKSGDLQRLESDFLDRLDDKNRDFAGKLLDLARASYQLRDDDNVYLGGIEAQLTAAVHEGRKRLLARGASGVDGLEAEDVERCLANPTCVRSARRAGAPRGRDEQRIRVRQVRGQPAGPGVVTGPARVVGSGRDVWDFQRGEILVCDAIDPNMTFVIPIAAGIVERRGGMLIHGAIIAREYGLPCVTGVPAAAEFIGTGDVITVDGYTGIVTVNSRRRRR